MLLLIFNGYAENGKELAVMKQGLSHSLSQNTDDYKIGSEDKIITVLNTNGNVEYSFYGACGVIYQGLIHFFVGGFYGDGNQHFGFD